MSAENTLRVEIAGASLGIPLEHVRSVERADAVQYSPARLGPLGWVLGREEVEIWQIHRLYGVEPPITGPLTLVRLAGDLPKALLVDEVGEKVEIATGSRFPTAAFATAFTERVISDVATVGNRALPLLDPTKLGAVDTATLATPTTRIDDGDSHERLLDAASALTSPAVGAETADRQVLAAVLDHDLVVALPLGQIRAVSQALVPERLPASPTFVPGVVSWSDQVAYWIDWRGILGAAAEAVPSRARWVIAAPNTGALVAFPAISAIMSLDPTLSLELVDPGDGPTSSLIAAAARFDDRLLIVPDLDALATYSNGSPTQ